MQLLSRDRRHRGFSPFFRIAIVALLMAGCGGDEGGGAAVLSTDSGGGTPDAGPMADAGPPGSDSGAVTDAGVAPDSGPVGCEDGAKRCADNAAWLCSGGVWAIEEACHGATCIDGACVCLPQCAAADGSGAVKECGSDGCGGSCGACPEGATCDEAAGVCTGAPPPPGPKVYTAVFVEDVWGGSCSSYNSSGADIRGAQLAAPGGEIVGYWEAVVAEPGTETCQNNYTNPDIALGEPSDQQLSLQGGWVVGSFAGKNAIGPGWSVTIFEFDGQMGGSSESYAVWLATDLSCPLQAASPKTECMKLVSLEGNGTTTFEISGGPL